MLSIVNEARMRCLGNYSPLDRPIPVLSRENLPWVDMAIGVILIVVGALAMHGYHFMPFQAGQVLVAIGSIQLIVGLVMKLSLFTNCITGFFIVKSLKDDRTSMEEKVAKLGLTPQGAAQIAGAKDLSTFQ